MAVDRNIYCGDLLYGMEGTIAFARGTFCFVLALDVDFCGRCLHISWQLPVNERCLSKPANKKSPG